LLYDSGILKEEPIKLFSKQETKMDMPKSKVKLHRTPVKKQFRTASRTKSAQDTATSLKTSSTVNSELLDQVCMGDSNR